MLASSFAFCNNHPAYKVLRQLSKPKCQPGRQLRRGISGRQLHTALERIAEWLRHVTQLFTNTLYNPLAVFQLNCLRRIFGISLHDHVSNVDILNRCNTLSVGFQPQGKRLRWLGHVFRMPNERLPKKLLFGIVKGPRPHGRPRSSFNIVALRYCQKCRIGRPYKYAQDRQLWRDKTCPART